MTFGSWRISLVERSHSRFCSCYFYFYLFVCRWWYSSFRWHRWGMAVRDPDRWGLGFLLGPAGVGRLRRPTLFYGEDCVPIVRDECFRKNSDYLWSTFWVLSCVNSNTWHLICNNFNLNFIYGTVCLYVCVFTHSRFVENLPIWSWETNPLFLRWFCHKYGPPKQMTEARILPSN
jgi:hypothetical protein